MISALSCHGNPLHPDSKTASEHHTVFEQTVQLAQRLGVKQVITFSGCPGGTPSARRPNWITAPWPPSTLRDARLAVEGEGRPLLDRHGEDLSGGRRARRHRDAPQLRRLQPRDDAAPAGCGARDDRLQLRSEPHVLAAVDVPVIRGARRLHLPRARERLPDRRAEHGRERRARREEVPEEIRRSWIFRTVGYGNGESVWRDIVSNLRLVGYDHVISIEHEDSLMSGDEGLKKAIAFLKQIVIEAPAGTACWA